jgi:hypothetical protein
MTYNPRYYLDYVEEAGYTKAQDMYAYLADISHIGPDGSGFNPKVLRIANRVRERMDVDIRNIEMRNIDRDGEFFKQVYNQAWSKNWGFVPLTDAELEHEIEALVPIVDPETVFFAFKKGRAIAAGLPLPDLNQALHRAYPRPWVPEWWTMLKLAYWWKVRKVVTTLRAFAGGVIEEYRGQGLHALMSVETLLRATRRYDAVEFSWVLESNIPMRQTAAHLEGKHYRTYRIYERAVL